MARFTPKQFLSTTSLPSLPEVAAALIRLLDDPNDVDFARVELLIKKDPAIAAAVMRQANSARFGLSTKVSSIFNALHVIGSANLRSIALGTSIAASMPACAAIDKATVVKYCELHAALASDLAYKARCDKNMAWLSGFICRLGELLMCQVDPNAALAIEEYPHAPGLRWRRQIQHFGFSEGAVMSELARAWNFPEQVVSALGECAQPMSNEYPFRELSGVTHVAGIMADAICLGQPTSTVHSLIAPDVMESLSMDYQTVIPLYAAHAATPLE
jgi:HD-like signal output (HDOD) protein